MPLSCPSIRRDRTSPNHGPRRVRPSILVLHYTGMRTAAEAIDRLCDPVARVSAHYVVEEDGTVHALVPEARRAWHAGVSAWHGVRDVNGASIGIEIVNPGHEWGYRPFPPAQIAAVTALARGILRRWRIRPDRVVGHSDVAPLRKIDPGELFPWRRLAAAGVGHWPSPGAGARTRAVTTATTARAGLRILARLGYAVPPALPLPHPTARAVIEAFQRRWCPAHLTGRLDGPTGRQLAAVAACYRSRRAIQERR